MVIEKSRSQPDLDRIFAVNCWTWMLKIWILDILLAPFLSLSTIKRQLTSTGLICQWQAFAWLLASS
jgi:hypothetical protein